MARKQQRADLLKVPGYRRTKGTVRRNLFDLALAEKYWAEKNADTLVVRQLSPEELSILRSSR